MNNDKINIIYEKFIEECRNISLHECSGGYPDKEDCTWYHSNWMLLRYLGVVSNPYWHESFYRNALEYINAQGKDFLVAGTADFSMPLLCSESGIEKICICDICETPLKICNMVSEFLGCDWTTYIQDICDKLPLKYDVIINDAFLSRFNDKVHVLNGISDGLKQGGYYITTLKQGKWNRGGEVTDLVRKSFVNKVKERYNKRKSSLPYFDIETVSTTYVSKMSSFPINNENKLHELFNNAGLNILHLEKGNVEGEFELSEYFRIVSQKK